jgi:CRISPR-associated protein Csb2
VTQHLVLSVRLHEDGLGTARYHGMSQGAPEWPPAPARVYQALIAGAARGQALPRHLVPALRWLETLPAPAIAAPHRTLGQAVDLFVPNNDADAMDDPRDVSGIRTAKFVRPSLFAADLPLLYAWPLPGEPATGSSAGKEHAAAIAEAANDLYQLGRGIDMAWAIAELLDDAALAERLSAHGGVVHRPEAGVRGSRMLACPAPGSFASLMQRHQAAKLRAEGAGKKARLLFVNPPKPRFASVCYERARTLAVFELRDRDGPKPWPWALGRAAKLVESLRDAAAAKLRTGLGGDAGAIERSLVGRAGDGSGAVPPDERLRIVPMPSIGSVHADRAIRRVLVEVPSGAPLRATDVEWAFSGLDWADPETGELCPLVVTRSESDDMLGHYVGPSRRWRSVTAVALPETARRRRIDPTRIRQEAKSAQERLAEEGRAAAAVRAALRHAGVLGVATMVRVQREPFDAKGVRAESFAEGTRFPKERLWHVEFELDRPIGGPLVIGDGRFVGLGVMAPAVETGERTAVEGVRRMPLPVALHGGGFFALAVVGRSEADEDAPIVLARALRRAVLARVRDVLGLAPDAGLDRFFSGHERDGAKSTASMQRHLAFQWDGPRRRLLVIAPHQLERRAPTWHERRQLRTLDRALEGLVDLRAGAAGCLAVQRLPSSPDDPLLTPAVSWSSVAPFAVTRHRKRSSAAEAVAADVLSECDRCGLPRPQVTVIDIRAASRQGLEARVTLRFATAVTGPIALGRTALLGGGLFAATGPS